MERRRYRKTAKRKDWQEKSMGRRFRKATKRKKT